MFGTLISGIGLTRTDSSNTPTNASNSKELFQFNK